MSTHSHALAPALGEYLRATALQREDALLRELRLETAKLEEARMQISVEQGRLMELLARVTGVRKAPEVGVFTGYSSICVARALPADGQLIACDMSKEWTDVARRFWDQAGVADRIELRLGPGGESLDALIAEGHSGTFDFAFVDADKAGYPGYYEQCLTLLRQGGLLGFDNAFMGGRVAEAEPEGSAKIVQELNARIYADDRVEPAFLPIGDGLLLVRKR